MPAATIAPTISHTLLETVKRCQKKAEYRYVLGYVPRIKGAKIERGTWIHELLAAFYGAIKDGRDGLVAAGYKHQQLLEEWWNPLFDEEKELLGKDLPDQAWKIFERYTLYWEDHDRRIMRKILWVEQEITIKLDWLPVPFTFKCDLVFLNQWNQVVIMDHKVVGTIPDEEDRLLDNQGPRYVLGMEEVLRRKGLLGNKIKGVVVYYDYIRDRVPAEPKLNKDGTLSRAKIDTDYWTYYNTIQKHGLNPDDYKDVLEQIAREQKPFFDRWAVTVTKQRLENEKREMVEAAKLLAPKDYYPRTLDRTRCRWDCEYKDLCLIEIQGGNIEHALKDRFEVVNRNGRG